MAEIRALIAAAGRGTRAGLPYPKTLYTVHGKPILLHIADAVRSSSAGLTVVVSPQGKEPISEALNAAHMPAELLVQTEARGMGHAVLCFEASVAFASTEHVLLVWGDVPFIQENTVCKLVEEHLALRSDFTFATRHADSAYTVVSRGTHGQVVSVVETREAGGERTRPGERDIGLFIFRKSPVMEILKEELPGKWGRKTGEHGFLYAIEHLAKRGYKVLALPIATDSEAVSLNSVRDLDGYV